jgi:hypothetical protein
MIGETVLASAYRVYGLTRVCRVRPVARSTIYYQRTLPAERQARRPGPIGAASDAEPISAIRYRVQAFRFRLEHPRLAMAIYARVC